VAPPKPSLETYVRELEGWSGGFNGDPLQFPSGRALLAAPLPEQADTFVAAWRMARATGAKESEPYLLWRLPNLLAALQQNRPPFTVEQLVEVLDAAAFIWQHHPSWLSPPPAIAAAEVMLDGGRPAELVEALERLREALRPQEPSYTDTEARRLMDRITVALEKGLPFDVSGRGPFGRHVAASLRERPSDTAWTALLQHALTATAAKPSARWCKQATPLLEAIGRAAAAEHLGRWLAAGPCPGEASGTRATDRDAELIKGILFVVAALAEPRLAPAVADLAAASLRKVPGVGPVSAKVGNACVHVLAALPGAAAITQLGRLKQLVKYATAQRLVQEALDEAARAAGVTADEIEEMSLPTYGLEAGGVSRRALGAVAAELAVADDDVTLTFRAADGRALRSAPAALRSEHPAALADLKRTAKEIAQVLPAQRLRLEGLMLTARALTWDQWRARYVEHPLVGDMSRRLIWSVEGAGEARRVMALDGRATDLHGAEVTEPPGSRVRLFHPLGVSPEETLAWRRLLEGRGVTQPFKQAHREVYELTDAERRTEIYSNRFAGHVLRQHQLAALCRDRGWAYHLQGGFDGANNPTLRVPGTDLVAELWTETPDGDGELAGSGIYLHVATDQVRFARDGGPVPLDRVPPLVFSEVMRDVDLFVSVCSIGTDPTWNDRGAGPQYGDYWQRFAFGELSVSAELRRQVLEAIVPKLKIRDRCSFDERHLVVRGELATYRIHLGSGNILMEPGSRYLCIVPGGKGVGTNIALPFRGDSLLAVILSKAFLLAEDRKISDPTITRQIGTRAGRPN
jgi:hypothetical protein